MFFPKSLFLNGVYKIFRTLKENFSLFFENLNVKVFLFLIFVFNLANFLYAYFLRSKINNDLMVLHYNIIFGVDLIGAPSKIYYLPLIGLIFSIINIVLLILVFKTSRLLNSLIFVFTLLVNIFIFLGLFSLYLVNF
jgi:hypothetical protein